MLDWSMLELAKVSQVSVSTIKRIEDSSENIPSDRSLAKLEHAFATEGVRFLADESGHGLWMQKR